MSIDMPWFTAGFSFGLGLFVVFFAWRLFVAVVRTALQMWWPHVLRRWE